MVFRDSINLKQEQKKKHHKAKTDPKSRYIDIERLEAQENAFLKKFILCISFLGS